MKLFVGIAFILTYVLIIIFSRHKHIITGISALIIGGVALCFGTTTFSGLLGAIDLNVVMVLVGIMLTVGMFTESEMPSKIADRLISKIPSTMWALTLLSILAGVVSAFIDNVATVLMFAPIGIAVARKTKVSPVPAIICIAVSSNLQGAATLVGDTTSVMLGSFAGLSFSEFFLLNGKLSIFFVVELGALATIPILLFVFRKNNGKLEYESENVVVKEYFSTVALLLNIVCLVALSFFNIDFKYLNGVVCMAFGVVTLVVCTLIRKSDPIKSCKEGVDYKTVLFLVFLFVIIGVVSEVGIIDDLSNLFVKIGSNNVFLLYTIIVFGSVILSAFIDNIPYVATMLPVIKGLCATMTVASPYLFYFGLLVGATLGGNLTPVGASANVVGMGILEKDGEKATAKDFFKIGVPMTLTAVLVGYVMLWLIWGM